MTGVVFDLLGAGDPSSRGGEDPSLYAGLIGSWSIESTWYKEGGGSSSARGEWHFAPILGGRGVQDVLFASGSKPEEYGTTLRCFDEAIGAWRVAWMQPSSGEFVSLVGRRAGDLIVQEGEGSAPGSRVRWSFSDIRPDSFAWRGEASSDGGATWRLEQEMRGTRMGKEAAR